MNDPLFGSTPAEERIKETVTKYVGGWRMAGPNDLVARCPFHDDSDPSFSMSVRTGLWLCYACGEHGNFRQFLEKCGLDKGQIARGYGRTLEALQHNAAPAPDPTHPNVVMEPNRHLPEDLLGLFRRGTPEKLLEEGFEASVLEDFQVGVDAAHNRITFPLRDLKGNLVGISGRAVQDGVEPRHKVYDEHEYKAWDLPPFRTDKSLLLWNAHRVYPAVMAAKATMPLEFPPKTLLQASPPVVVVEGFKACMWVAQAGFQNVVALMTKSMSWTQKWLLQRMGGNYILWLDHDGPGMEGIISICKELREVSSTLRVVECDARQPTDVPMVEAWQLIKAAPSYTDIMVP